MTLSVRSQEEIYNLLYNLLRVNCQNTYDQPQKVEDVLGILVMDYPARSLSFTAVNGADKSGSHLPILPEKII